MLSGLFALIGRLFGVSVAPADGEAAVWHPDVRFFRLSPSAGGAPFAYVYLDPYARPATKRGGAWMDDVCGRSAALAAQPPQPGAAAAASPAAAAAGPRLAVAHMVCNGTPPVGGAPSLMTFREVETLFHEMGHALQHMLTKVDEGLVSGIRGVEWDAVELPSQFMEARARAGGRALEPNNPPKTLEHLVGVVGGGAMWRALTRPRPAGPPPPPPKRTPPTP